MSLEMLHGHKLDIVPVASIRKLAADQTHYCETHCWINRNTQRNNHNDKGHDTYRRCQTWVINAI